MISQIKLYLGAAAMAVIGIFAAIFKYRGAKIESLKSDNSTLKENSDKLDDVIQKKDKEIEIRETINQIYSSPSSVDESFNRLRKRKEDRESRSK